MNKNVIIILVLVALLLLGGIGYAMRGSSVPNKIVEKGLPEISEVTKSDKNEKDSSITGNLFDLMKKGADLECDYTGDTVATEATGKTYISGKKVRGDYRIVDNGKVVENHLVSDGEYMYTWSSEIPQGVKMNINEYEKKFNSITKEDKQIQNENTFQNSDDYKCSNWKVDNSVFSVPTNIEFLDYSQMMKDFSIDSTDSTTPSTNDICSSCDAINDFESKAQCKASLNCN